MNQVLSPGVRLGLLAATLALSGCVSEAALREGDHEPPRDARTAPDAQEGGADSGRGDARDSALPDDIDVPADSGDAHDEPADDARGVDASDARGVDASDARGFDASDARGVDASDARGFDASDARGFDASDATEALDVTDVTTDVGGNHPDARADVSDATTAIDASDASAPLDVGDSSAPGDAATDGGVLVFYTENFDTGLGGFSTEVTNCGSGIIEWTNRSGYAHASEPEFTDVSRISSPVITVPSNVSNVILSMGHEFDMESGRDCAQLLVSVNGAAATQVTMFTAGAYTTGGQTNPTTCEPGTRGQYPGWSGIRAEAISTANLAPFDVVAGSTVTLSFQMLADDFTGGVGWDINWVTLSGDIR